MKILHAIVLSSITCALAPGLVATQVSRSSSGISRSAEISVGALDERLLTMGVVANPEFIRNLFAFARAQFASASHAGTEEQVQQAVLKRVLDEASFWPAWLDNHLDREMAARPAVDSVVRELLPQARREEKREKEQREQKEKEQKEAQWWRELGPDCAALEKNFNGCKAELNAVAAQALEKEPTLTVDALVKVLHEVTPAISKKYDMDFFMADPQCGPAYIQAFAEEHMACAKMVPEEVAYNFMVLHRVLELYEQSLTTMAH